ncbi:Aste57867_10643 [Aphanomyces stellatus]|uniref:Aste57867_10643 protein n=1 Tax=Aphanomyces stellatus TaxID=120398 RepID=A0A485KRF5_9STRA|nr:hypothetical protein As57867_010603 [Aphanomyces stellatus]VFT87515.1 Aste57867_10643 [Aphanomyces stellatus]
MSVSVAFKRQKLLTEKAMLQRSLTLIEEEKHEDFLSRLAPLEADKLRLIAKAETLSAHLVNSADVIFAYESEEAEKEFQMNCSKLKQDMLEEIRLEMERVKEQKKSGFGSASYNKAALALQRQSNMRKTRSSKKPGGSMNAYGFSEEWARPSTSKRLTTVFTPLHKILPLADIAHDMDVLEREVIEAATAPRGNTGGVALPDHTSILARFVHGKVLYKDVLLQEEDHVRVTKLMPPPDGTVVYKAIICDITSAEIFVLKENGKYTRLLVQDLRTGSVVVEHVVDGDDDE